MLPQLGFPKGGSFFAKLELYCFGTFAALSFATLVVHFCMWGAAFDTLLACGCTFLALEVEVWWGPPSHVALKWVGGASCSHTNVEPSNGDDHAHLFDLRSASNTLFNAMALLRCH